MIRFVENFCVLLIFFCFSIESKSISFICFSGPYGYRPPGSDYGEHGRRANGAWGADSGDDASETSSICSERSLEVRCRSNFSI